MERKIESYGKKKEAAVLPALEVKNEVLWVNPYLKHLPFVLKEGEPCKFGLFLTPSDKIKKWVETSGPNAHLAGVIIGIGKEVEEKIETKKLQARRGHYRSCQVPISLDTASAIKN